jgi:hypothetical protein
MLKDEQRWIARYVMANFTPVSAAIGGALIGLSAVLLMLFTGRIAGVSGIFDALINPQTSDRAWRGICWGPRCSASCCCISRPRHDNTTDAGELHHSRHVGSNPSHLIFAEQLGRRSSRHSRTDRGRILPATTALCDKVEEDSADKHHADHHQPK